MPNTPVEELIQQIPVIAIIIATAVVVMLVCTLIFVAFVVTKCIKYKLQSQEKKVTNRLSSAEKTIDKSDKMFSKTYCKEHANKGSNIVREVAGDRQSHRNAKTLSGPPPKKNQTDSSPESGQRLQQLPASSHAIASFVADKMYIGLSHPRHGKTFREIVQKIMDDTRQLDTEGVSENTTSFTEPDTQWNGHAGGSDEKKSANLE